MIWKRAGWVDYRALMCACLQNLTFSFFGWPECVGAVLREIGWKNPKGGRMIERVIVVLFFFMIIKLGDLASKSVPYKRFKYEKSWDDVSSEVVSHLHGHFFLRLCKRWRRKAAFPLETNMSVIKEDRFLSLRSESIWICTCRANLSRFNKQEHTFCRQISWLFFPLCLHTKQ